MSFTQIFDILLLSWGILTNLALIILGIQCLLCSHEENQKNINKEDFQNGSQS